MRRRSSHTAASSRAPLIASRPGTGCPAGAGPGDGPAAAPLPSRTGYGTCAAASGPWYRTLERHAAVHELLRAGHSRREASESPIGVQPAGWGVDGIGGLQTDDRLEHDSSTRSPAARLLFGSISAWWGLANVMDKGWAALIVAGVWAIVAAVLFAVGRGQMKQVNPKPELTVETVKERPTAAAAGVARPGSDLCGRRVL